jgi:hypothetical protein
VKPCWKEHGLGERGAEQADVVLGDLCSVLKDLCVEYPDVNIEELAKVAFKEACFRVFELPKRSLDFHKKYLKENA